MPKVSVLIPSFNREEYIAACIESTLGQTWKDLEVVVVDGASTDGTWSIIERFTHRDARVRAFRDAENGGPVLGWWRCLEEARGELATFLWSDDMHQPEFLERTVSMINDSVAFAYTAAEIGEAPGRGVVNYARPTGVFASERFIAGALREDGAYPVSPACGLFRLDDLRRSFTATLPTDPPFDLQTTGAGTDLLFFLKTAERYPWVASIEEPLAFFRSHPGSLTIDGRGGLVRRSYAVTRAWFGRSIGDERAAFAALAAHWISDMAVSRRFISPGRAASEYAGLVSPARLALAGVPAVLRKVAWRLRPASPPA